MNTGSGALPWMSSRSLVLLSMMILGRSTPAVQVQTLGDALDAPALTWSTSGGSLWNAQTIVTHDGVDAAAGSGGSTLRLDITGHGTLAFYWKFSFSGGMGMGSFGLSVDGTNEFLALFPVDWTYTEKYLGPGTHVVTWLPIAPMFGSANAYVDQVVWVPEAGGTVTASVSAISVPEGQTALFDVALSADPGARVTVMVYRASGDANLVVQSGSNLVFDSSNWDIPETVELAAAEDEDVLDGSALIECQLDLPFWNAATVTAYEVDNDLPIGDSVDKPDLAWTTGGDVNWRGQAAITHDGADAAQSGDAVPDSGSSWVETQVTGPCQVSFWWKVSSQAGDTLAFAVNGAPQFDLNGESGWVQRVLSLTDSVATLRWTYAKDGSGSAGSDAGWLDEFSWTPTGFILVSTNSLKVPEGGTGSFGLRLGNDPGGAVTVIVARGVGDTNLSVQSGASLLFNSGNWSADQTVVIAAAEDADVTEGIAQFTCSINNPSWRTALVAASERENDSPPQGVEIVIWRLAAGGTNEITELRPDGTLVWENAPGVLGTTIRVQRCSAPDTCEDYTAVLATSLVQSLQVFTRFRSPAMVYIPGGEYAMGDHHNWPSIPAGLLTQHMVYVSAFLMDKYEVTLSACTQLMLWAVANGYTPLFTWGGKGPDHPVLLNWYACAWWCNARSEYEGLTPCYTLNGSVYRTGTEAPGLVCNWSANGYRLPTEAEWERAARGGAATNDFPWTTDPNRISHAKANYYGNAPLYAWDLSTGHHPTYAAGVTPYTSPVGSFAPNAYGLHDMAGNVAEFCWDWYDQTYYLVSPYSDPTGPGGGDKKVGRGGSWGGSAGNDGSFSTLVFPRSGYPISAVGVYETVGFRCVRRPQ